MSRRNVRVTPKSAYDRCALCKGPAAEQCSCGTALHAACLLEFELGCPACGYRPPRKSRPPRLEDVYKRREEFRDRDKAVSDAMNGVCFMILLFCAACVVLSWVCMIEEAFTAGMR